MSRLGVLLGCAAFIACGGQGVISLKYVAASGGSLALRPPSASNPGSVVASLSWPVPTGMSDGEVRGCEVLGKKLRVTLNGVAPVASRGVVGSSSPDSCPQPSFTFSMATLGSVTDAELILSDDMATLRLVARNALIVRTLTRIGDFAQAKPGAQLEHAWLPTTDSPILGSGGFTYPDQTLVKFEVRHESDLLVFDLPAAPWSAGTSVNFGASAFAPVDTCDGGIACQVLLDPLHDDFALPAL